MDNSADEISFIKLTDPKTSESIEICPDLGGTIKSITLGKEMYQILANDSKEDFLKNPLFRGRILFPFNDRIPEAAFSFRGQKYLLPVNNDEDNSAIHGFIYNEKVSILKQTINSISLYWQTGNNRFKGYPFDVSLQTDLIIQNGKAVIEFTVKNRGDTIAPFGLGWHSYFKADQQTILKADYSGYFQTDKNYLPIGNIIPTTDSEFDFSRGSKFLNRDLDHTFKVPQNGISKLINNNYSVIIKQTNLTYTQLFIPPDKKSIAIEPVSSKPNSFNSNEVLTLKPGNEYKAKIEISLESV